MADRILAVEDVKETSALLCTAIGQRGYAVKPAYTGTRVPGLLRGKVLPGCCST